MSHKTPLFLSTLEGFCHISFIVLVLVSAVLVQSNHSHQAAALSQNSLSSYHCTLPPWYQTADKQMLATYS